MLIVLLYLTMMSRLQFFIKNYVPNDYFPYVISTSILMSKAFIATSIYINYYFHLYTGLNPIIFIAILVLISSRLAKSAVNIQLGSEIRSVI